MTPSNTPIITDSPDAGQSVDPGDERVDDAIFAKRQERAKRYQKIMWPNASRCESGWFAIVADAEAEIAAEVRKARREALIEASNAVCPGCRSYVRSFPKSHAKWRSRHADDGSDHICQRISGMIAGLDAEATDAT